MHKRKRERKREWDYGGRKGKFLQTKRFSSENIKLLRERNIEIAGIEEK